MFTSAILAMVVLAAGDPVPADEEPGPLETPGDARETFRARAEPILKESFSGEARRYWLEHLSTISDEDKWSVRRQPFREAWQRVDDTLTEEERKSPLIRHGTLEALREAEGDCWAVEFANLTGLIGYLDARTGRLIFLWTPPEG